MCVLLVTGCSEGSENAKEKAGSGMGDPEITEMVINEFSLLTKIPRPSHHEKQISDFLVDWAKEHVFSPKQDDVYNIMFDVPATKGYEDTPLCVLQGHMDMVVAVEDGKDFDPLKDPITMIRDEKNNTLTTDGTSLGADDGIRCRHDNGCRRGENEPWAAQNAYHGR